MWTAFKNVETGTVHAVSLPGGMSPHGFAMGWPLEQTTQPLTCHLCLRFAHRWGAQDAGLKAMLRVDTVKGSRLYRGGVS
jgi:hypothetical protein